MKPDVAARLARNAFNWLAQKPQRNFTLGEAFQRIVLKKPYAEIDANKLGFSNAGRAVERLHVAGGILSAAFIVAAAPAIGVPLALAAAGTVIGLYKTMGLAAGKLADLAFRGTLRQPKI